MSAYRRYVRIHRCTSGNTKIHKEPNPSFYKCHPSQQNSSKSHQTKLNGLPHSVVPSPHSFPPKPKPNPLPIPFRPPQKKSSPYSQSSNPNSLYPTPNSNKSVTSKTPNKNSPTKSVRKILKFSLSPTNSKNPNAFSTF